MMGEIYIVGCYCDSLTSSYDPYFEYFIDDIAIALSDDNDMDIADNRILTEWRVLRNLCSNLSLSRLSAVYAVATEKRTANAILPVIGKELRYFLSARPQPCEV